MTIQPQLPQESKIYTLDNQPWFFGHFLNLGRHNAFLILKQLQHKYLALQQPVQPPEPVDEEKLHSAWVLNAAWNDARWQAQLLEDLYHFFPFLRHIAEPDFARNKEGKPESLAGKNVKEIPTLLKNWLQHLNTLRNSLVHYSPRHDWAINLLQSDKLERLYKDIPAHLLRRYPQTFKEEDVKHLKNEEYRPFKDGMLTPKGLYLFTCLWLSRRQANEFFNHIQYFKDTRETRFRATRYGFALYCTRPPEPRVTSSHTALDILAELDRIPEPLYRLLSDEDKKKFQVEPVADEAGEFDIEDTLSTPLMIRKRDRFPRFVFSFFEQRPELLGDMRFHLKLGQVVLRTYPKSAGTISHRILVRDLFTWGFVPDFSEPEKEYNLRHRGWLERGKLTPHVQQFRPRYHLTDRGFGLRFQKNWPMALEAWPDLNEDSPQWAPPPHAILPTDALPSLLAWELVRHRHPEWNMPAASEVLQTAWQHLRAFFEKVENGTIAPVSNEEKLAECCQKYHIDPADLPKRLKKYLLGEQPDANRREAALQWFKHKIEETDRLIRRLTAQRKRLQEAPEKRTFLRAGEVATWLVRDICYFQHPDGHQLNNDEYRDLQATLAYFGREGSEAVMNKLEQLGLMGKPDKDHPFLYKLRHKTSIRGVLDFYRAYLNEKRSWLKQQTNRLRRDNPIDKYLRHAVPSLRERALPPYMTGYPVVLPPALLRRRLAHILKEKGGKHTRPEDSLETILSQLDEWEAPQAFYNLRRIYRIKSEYEIFAPAQTDFAAFAKRFKSALTGAAAIKETDASTRELIELGQKLWKRINRTEKLLRRYALQDRLLWWLARTLLEQDDGQQIGIEGWKLQEIGFDQPDSPMRQEVKFSLKMTDEDGQMHTIKAHMRPRHYGKMQRTLRDRRVPGLLTWFPTDQSIPLDWLQRELQRTATRQDEVLQKVYELEEKIWKTFTNACRNAMQKGRVPHRQYLRILEDQDLINSTQREQLEELRNRFAHNEIPSRYRLPLWENSQIENTQQLVMDWLVGKSIKLYDEIIARIDHPQNTSRP